MGDLGELFHLGIPWWHLVIRAALIYVIFFIGLRLFGKRELGQFTAFDLVLVLLVANALQPAMTGPDSSITGGMIIVATLLLFNRSVASSPCCSPMWPDPPPSTSHPDCNSNRSRGAFCAASEPSRARELASNSARSSWWRFEGSYNPSQHCRCSVAPRPDGSPLADRRSCRDGGRATGFRRARR